MSKIGSHRCRSFTLAGLAEDLELTDRSATPGSFPPGPNGRGAPQRRCKLLYALFLPRISAWLWACPLRWRTRSESLRAGCRLARVAWAQRTGSYYACGVFHQSPRMSPSTKRMTPLERKAESSHEQN